MDIPWEDFSTHLMVVLSIKNSDGNTTKSGLIIVTSRRDVTGIMLSKGNRYTYQAITYYIILDPI